MIQSSKPSDKNAKKRTQPKPAAVQEKQEKEAKAPVSAPTLPKGTKLVYPPGPQWYGAVDSLSTPTAPLPLPTASQLSSLTERAANILKRDADLYSSSAASTGHSSSDSHFLNSILSQGTLSDRLSALTLLVQGSPVHNTKALESLKGMAERGRGKGGREEGLKAMRCIVDWWVGGGAPNRKLRQVPSFCGRGHILTGPVQILAGPAIPLTPRCHRRAPYHVVFRRLAEEVLLLHPSDSRGTGDCRERKPYC